VIWRGWAQDSVEDVLNKQDRMAKKIHEAVTRMLATLPPKLKVDDVVRRILARVPRQS
jgi:hypothetical protein